MNDVTVSSSGMRREAGQLREETLRVVAHELRNPLSAIELAATAVAEDLVDGTLAETGDSVRIILRSCLRAQRLVRDLLDSTSIGAGHLRLTRRSVNAGGLVREFAARQRGILSSAKLELSLQIDDRERFVWADRDRLFQVLENLMGNSVKFTAGGGCVAIGVKPYGDFVVFRVSDSGIGIATEHVPLVWQPFWQAGDDDHRGLGLGLSIAKGIVEAHGGSMWIQSQPGVGTSIYFRIPDLPER